MDLRDEPGGGPGILVEVANAYRVLLGNLPTRDGLAKALAEWTECPTLPEAISPL
jgi:hypothetical protein